jgi:hypothetical protein
VMNPILVLALLLIGIGFSALYRNLNRRSKGNTTVNPNLGKNEVRTEEDRQKRRAMVAALVVGQDVYVVSKDGRDFRQGKVIEVTPEGVEVLPENCSSCSCHRRGMLFDNEGNNGHDIHDGMDVWGFGGSALGT